MPESRIDDLNPERLRAATAGEGPVLTIAGAGTGKTKTLASRVAWLVSQGIDPSRIMLLTFTRRASDEMLRRARRALGETGSRALGTVWGGTFHSVALRGSHFRAAEVRNILDLPSEFPGATVVTLETNYRSTQPILDVTNRIIRLSPRRHAKELCSVKGDGPKPALITCEREDDQTDFVVEKILEHNENGLGLRRQAVLVRTAYWSDHLEVELTRRNIPYRKYGGLKFLEAAHIKDLVLPAGARESARPACLDTHPASSRRVGPAVAKRACEAVAESGGDIAAAALPLEIQ